MKIYTRTGDAGSTGLFGGPRVAKDDDRIEAYGTVDELNAAIGMVRSGLVTPGDPAVAPETDPNGGGRFADIDDRLCQVQHELFSIGAELATPDPDSYDLRIIDEHHIETMETWIDELESELSPLKHFILPAGHTAASTLHLARSICRRAERRTVTLVRRHEVSISEALIVYLNRLSDLLFVLTRVINHRAGIDETKWVSPTRGNADTVEE